MKSQEDSDSSSESEFSGSLTSSPSGGMVNQDDDMRSLQESFNKHVHFGKNRGSPVRDGTPHDRRSRGSSSTPPRDHKGERGLQTPPRVGRRLSYWSPNSSSSGRRSDILCADDGSEEKPYLSLANIENPSSNRDFHILVAGRQSNNKMYQCVFVSRLISLVDINLWQGRVPAINEVPPDLFGRTLLFEGPETETQHSYKYFFEENGEYNEKGFFGSEIAAKKIKEMQLMKRKLLSVENKRLEKRATKHFAVVFPESFIFKNSIFGKPDQPLLPKEASPQVTKGKKKSTTTHTVTWCIALGNSAQTTGVDSSDDNEDWEALL